jgi:hypothetical protein
MHPKVVFVSLLTALAPACGYIPGTDANLERQSRDVMTDQLLDAPSARFQKLRALVDRTHGKPIEIICGEVDAKNAMGAYVGFRRFIVVPGERFARSDPAADDLSSNDRKMEQGSFSDAYAACETGKPS